MARKTPNGPLADAKLETVFLWTRDFRAMRSFYHDVLGLAITYENPHFANLHGSGASIALHAEREAHSSSDNWHIEFLVDDLDGVVAELLRRGVVTDPIREESFGRITTFRDPEGNEIGLEEPPRRAR